MRIETVCMKRSILFVGMLALVAFPRQNSGQDDAVKNGTDTPGRYFAAEAADVFVIHESDHWPTEAQLHGNYFGSYSDYPPATRATLMYSQSMCDPDAIKMARRYSRWVYVTQDTYKLNDADHPNPWDNLSAHLETMCRTLAE